jgi:hypothetical protein
MNLSYFFVYVQIRIASSMNISDEVGFVPKSTAIDVESENLVRKFLDINSIIS